ncbi:Phospholipase D protein [Pseudomonas syringae pv. maculicola]|uniref:Phospholipase D protein n=2 Tax=Pseudomonas syringae group genomosp. 3 TaxID=251701 RepID=A0A3M6BDH0_PSEYM|nr:Phospholipase D protein [Pseudomonas syringae pv. maculicola]
MTMTTPSITTPVATSKNMSCNINLPWFVQGTEYCPAEATFEPLVNGERAFGAVYDAIMKAEQSVEIICWGFQPSMYFKRGDTSSLCIGQLLAMKADKGVKVRILCWSDSAHVTAAFSENMTPGRNLASGMDDLRNETQHAIDWEWYRRATKSTLGNRSLLLDRTSTALAGAFSFGKEPFKNIEFVVRDMSLLDRVEIAWQVAMRSTDKDRPNWNKIMTTVGMTSIPTHHQKMVLIDYETPNKAVGFVMGHNSLDAYWDNDDHSAARMHAQFGRNGATPRQDISSRVTGPILEYLNHNFTQAWRHETGVDLLPARRHVAGQLKTRKGHGPRLIAQILRTQPQENKRDIREMYLKAAGNANSFMYLENQYFRWPPLAEKIKENVRRQFTDGRSLTEHGPLYLFVVTNSTKEGMGDGTINTYRMLRQLGRPELMPNVARYERDKELEAQVAQAKERYDTAQGKITIIEGTYGRSFNPAMSKLWEPQRKAASAAEAEYRALKAKLPAAKAKSLTMPEIEGLKVIICTLVAPDSPPEAWMDVYIHSKLMIIDDVFTTLGSSNINTRSMEVDSELNICAEDPAVAKPLRKHLWSIHAGGEGAGDDIKAAFNTWSRVASFNAANRKNSKNTSSPTRSLTEFYRESKKRSNLD